MKHITTSTYAFEILQGDLLSGKRNVNIWFTNKEDHRIGVTQHYDFDQKLRQVIAQAGYLIKLWLNAFY